MLALDWFSLDIYCAQIDFSENLCSKSGHPSQKKASRKTCFFQLNPPSAEEIHLRWVKSPREEICLTAGDGGGFNFYEKNEP
jgi:hypothetical protein